MHAAVFIFRKFGNINPFRWKSFYYDVETGLYYANGRYYKVECGVSVKALKAFDKLLLSDGSCAIIESIQVEKLSVPETTYNFEVEDFHTYYVSESKVLVHNECVKKERKKAVKEAWKQEQQKALNGEKLSRKWTPNEIEELKASGKVKGYHGHHMKSVKGYPELAGDPSNIQFLTCQEHLLAHGGNWQNITHGKFLG